MVMPDMMTMMTKVVIMVMMVVVVILLVDINDTLAQHINVGYTATHFFTALIGEPCEER